jgi:hypothetical protein
VSLLGRESWKESVAKIEREREREREGGRERDIEERKPPWILFQVPSF